jgi:hypothetical protein
MCAKASARGNTVFVNDAKMSKVLVVHVLIPDIHIISSVYATFFKARLTHVAKEKVWKVFNQPWSA